MHWKAMWRNNFKVYFQTNYSTNVDEDHGMGAEWNLQVPCWTVFGRKKEVCISVDVDVNVDVNNEQ
jgi:hypothetical protein